MLTRNAMKQYFFRKLDNEVKRVDDFFTQRVSSTLEACHGERQVFGNQESAESTTRRRFVLARQCALHSARIAGQWWSIVMLIPTARRERSSPLASTRILGRRTATFPRFLISNRVPRGFTQEPSTD